jgi:hypothetical protein
MSGANTAGICVSFKAEILQAFHNLGTTNTRAGTGADTVKGALYYQNEGIGAATTAYSATGEVAGTGYTAGGEAVTNANPPTTAGTTGYWTPSANLQWTGLTISALFDCLLYYNSSQNNRAIMAYNFGAQTVTSGTFTITMPPNLATTALLTVN